MKTLATLTFIWFLFVASCPGIAMGEATVLINNRLGGGAILRVHCKSKDDDLGVHDIKESWSFSFTPNFFEDTLFFCSFSWPGRFEWFDIYKEKRDWHYCEQCIWNILPDSPCRVDSLEYDACYPWNLKPLMWMSDRELIILNLDGIRIIFVIF